MSSLTPIQRRVLQVLSEHEYVTGDVLAVQLSDGEHSFTAQGAVQSASSLVRRGLASKYRARISRSRPVVMVYAITDVGRSELAAR